MSAQNRLLWLPSCSSVLKARGLYPWFCCGKSHTGLAITWKSRAFSTGKAFQINPAFRVCARTRLGRCTGKKTRDLRPGGASGNSPAFQRRVCVSGGNSIPLGTPEMGRFVHVSAVPTAQTPRARLKFSHTLKQNPLVGCPSTSGDNPAWSFVPPRSRLRGSQRGFICSSTGL